MSITISELAHALGARFWGDGSLIVTGAAEPAEAGPGRIALALNPKYAAALQPGAAAIISEGMDPQALGLSAAIFAARPRLAMAGLTQAFDPGPDIAPGIHPSAIIDPSAQVPADAAIGPFAVIGPDVTIGRGARIAAHVSIGRQTNIGDGALILAGARIGARVTAGAELIVQPGAVIGADGFSFVTEVPSAAEDARAALGQGAVRSPEAARWHRIHSLGSVVLGDRVEVGANSTIDRGTIRATRIGDGTKLDNLVQVGHNVEVGRDCLLCGQVGVAGSARIGDRVILGGQCGVSDNIFVGSDVVAGGATKIYSNVPAGRVILGHPAMRIESEIEIRKALRRLPRLFQRVARLEGGGAQVSTDEQDPQTGGDR
ncbi:UDP-3-O-(3-hydroxymyristoyl)glucosamine N-acyltransferase [Paracoccus suum]|uniref:UDP-3-O-acylglucosamine N-acyltransferase n=1 Tax=Paracoccus suum TaxID=2259340 RepID=A0A344PLU8_9RHOB|nr:UDP-3-O-(3-hydroxymyristoyl)glucosamine N-acyltransferase [Paracoccus suum]AXC50353.1 UDP-3-O-(3-hydroxymyristoyl)glucosamine N-acyltransferase [Paracoccus suum]